MTPVVGLDIGGTSTDAVALAGGRVLAHISLPTHHDDHSAVAATATAAARAALETAGADVPSSIGVGIPGLVDSAAGATRHAVNLGVGEEPLAIGPLLSSAFGVPVAVDNDARTAAVGVWAAAAESHPHLTDMAYISVGTGISAGLVLGGRLHRGWGGAAGEIGHIVVDSGGRSCKCGQRGCLETLTSGEAVRDVPTSLEAAAPLARIVSALVLTLDVEQVWLGGGVVHHNPGLVEALRSALTAAEAESPLLARLAASARLFTTDPSLPVGAIGAARLADGNDGSAPPLATQTTTRKGE